MKNDSFDQLRGSSDYVTSEPLRNAVNVTIALGRPLLIRGEPGTGKTLLAHSIARGLGKKLIIWNIKSTTKAHDVAWNKIGVPHACTRCCVHFEHGALARNGYLTTIIERPANNTEPNCRWLFYKDVDDIPEKYYERIGATKPKSQK